MESPFRCLDEFDVFMVSCTSSLFGGDPDFKIYFYVDENDDGYNFFSVHEHKSLLGHFLKSVLFGVANFRDLLMIPIFKILSPIMFLLTDLIVNCL